MEKHGGFSEVFLALTYRMTHAHDPRREALLNDEAFS
jgi:hypothetical protein